MRWTILVAMALVASAMLSGPALASGDEGHEVIALIAQEHLNPIVQKKLRAFLAADTDNLTTHHIATASQ
jgi:nuclease S1